MNNQNIKIEWKHQIQIVRQVIVRQLKPSAYCQACLMQKTQANDFMLTCVICESSIHKSHYASQIVGKTTSQNHLTPNIQDWKCQRCRYLIQRKFQSEVKCEFCPFPRGIMKRVIYQPVLNSRKQIWVHPQCTTWSFPLIYMKSKKRTHYFREAPTLPTCKFWFRVENQSSAKCTLCADSYGYKIKCSFYSCQKFYHITCAKRVGVIRDLQSMRLDNSDVYCPAYCEEHLQAYVLDFVNRIKIYTQKKQTQKVMHFTKVHNSYKIQLRNLTNSAKRSKQEDEIRTQLGKQSLAHNFEESSMSLSISEPLSNQMNSSESQSHSSTFLQFLENTYSLNDLGMLLQKKNIRKGQTYPGDYMNMVKQKPVKIVNQQNENFHKIQEEKELSQGQFRQDFTQERVFCQKRQVDSIRNVKQSQKMHLLQQSSRIQAQGIVEEHDGQKMQDQFQLRQSMIRQKNNQMAQEYQLQNNQYEKLSFSFHVNEPQCQQKFSYKPQAGCKIQNMKDVEDQILCQSIHQENEKNALQQQTEVLKMQKMAFKVQIRGQMMDLQGQVQEVQLNMNENDLNLQKQNSNIGQRQQCSQKELIYSLNQDEQKQFYQSQLIESRQNCNLTEQDVITERPNKKDELINREQTKKSMDQQNLRQSHNYKLAPGQQKLKRAQTQTKLGKDAKRSTSKQLIYLQEEQFQSSSSQKSQDQQYVPQK